MPDKKLSLSLFILRITLAIFLGFWASLKFYRPEWTENIFKGPYGLDFITKDFALYLGIAQLAIVLLFAIGYQRTIFYGLMLAMHAVGTYGAIGGLMKYTNYPNNLLLTGIPTLGALLALFILRAYDRWTIDGLRKSA